MISSTSLLVEASKSKTDDCAGKWGEDRGREKETRGYLRISGSQTRLKVKKKKRNGALIGNEVRRLTKAQSNGPKSIANKNEKWASQKLAAHFLKLVTRKRLWKRKRTRPTYWPSPL